MLSEIFNSRKVIIQSLEIGFALTIISFVIAMAMGWTNTVNIIEFLAVMTSFSCTYMVVMETRFNYIMGVITVALYAYLFMQEGLIGSMVLNLYLIPTLIYGWFIWNKDDDTLPVEHVKLNDVWVYVGVSAWVFLGAYEIIKYFDGVMPFQDAWILIGSILAQFLLSHKKIETWFVWAAVNILAIYVYFNAGLYLVTFQYVIFLFNTMFGYYMWNKSMKG